MMGPIAVLLSLAGMTYAYLRGRQDKAADVRACRLNQKATQTLRQTCIQKYGREAVEIIEDETESLEVPTDAEIAEWWGLGKTRKGA